MTEEIIDDINKLDGMTKIKGKCGYEIIGGCSDLRRLEQENKELKEIINKSARSFCNDYLKTFEENKFLNKQIMEVKFNAQQEIEFSTEENNTYRSALEEIKNSIINYLPKENYKFARSFNPEEFELLENILTKINEVLK